MFLVCSGEKLRNCSVEMIEVVCSGFDLMIRKFDLFIV